MKYVLGYYGMKIRLTKLNYFQVWNFKMEVWVKVHLQAVADNHSVRIFYLNYKTMLLCKDLERPRNGIKFMI